MKKFIALFALVLSTVAAAESTMIFETQNTYADVEASFEVNKDLGRAWVNVVLSETSGDSTTYQDNRVKIEGLSYDVASKNIILQKDGQEIICGNVYNRRWVIDFGGSVRNSDRCSFTVKKAKKQIDNGFEIYTVRILQVFMNVE